MKQMTLDFSSQTFSHLDGIVAHSGIQLAWKSLVSIIAHEGTGCASPILIHGVPGSGKTTLLRSFFNSLADSGILRQEHIRLVGPQLDSSRFPDLEELDRQQTDGATHVKIVGIDDVHRIAADDSYSFWNIFNMLARQDGILVMTSRLHPSVMFEGNDHLRSRLLSGLVISIELPSDAERLLLLDHMARLKGFRLGLDVCNYILRRKSRNLKELDSIVRLLDSKSLETKKRVTIPMVKELEQLGLI